jgi:hypothetical protein
MISPHEMLFLSLRACSSEPYKNAYADTLHAAAQLAEAFPLLEGKPRQEKHELLGEAESLAHRIVETFDSKKPLIAALGLLLAIRVLEQMVKNQTAELRGGAQ